MLLDLNLFHRQFHLPSDEKLYFPVILSEIIPLLVFVFCIFLLIKGRYSVSAHLFLITAMAFVWVVLFVHTGNTVTRLDTIILIVALLNLIPLFITKYKVTIVFYILANLLLLVGLTYLTLKYGDSEQDETF